VLDTSFLAGHDRRRVVELVEAQRAGKARGVSHLRLGQAESVGDALRDAIRGLQVRHGITGSLGEGSSSASRVVVP
jgi:hypothetical protein